MRFAVVVAGCLAVCGCSATQSLVEDLASPQSQSAAPTRLHDPVADARSLVSEVYNYKKLVGYGWNGNTYADVPQLNRAIDDAVSRDMTKLIQPVSVGAAVKVLRPNPRGLGTVPEIANLRLAEARIEALRKSGLFSSLRVENSGPGKFVAKGGDYALQYAGVTWVLRDGEDRQIEVGNGSDLSVFVGLVSQAVKRLREDADYLYVLHNVAGTPGGDTVLYRDRKYPDLVSLVDAFDRTNAELSAQVAVAAKPLGGNALLILPRHAPDVSLLRPGEKPGLIDSARKAYRLALDKRFVRFVQASKTFANLTVVFADDVGAIPLEYDWVMWRDPNAAAWSARSRDDSFGTLDLSMQPGGFAAALARALTLPPDPELDAPGPAPDQAGPRYYAR